MKRGLLWGCLLLNTMFGAAFGMINGGFEESAQSEPSFIPPVGWSYENHAGVYSSFVPTPRPNHTKPEAIDWSIGAPYEGERFVLLSTGDMDPISELIIFSASISQDCTFNAGDQLSFAWFFGTNDWYTDNATASLIPVDPADNLSEILLFEMTVEDADIEYSEGDSVIGKFSSTGDWQTFEYTFDELTAGQYALTFEVSDTADAIYSSYFAIDAVSVVPEPATLVLMGFGGLLLGRRK